MTNKYLNITWTVPAADPCKQRKVIHRFVPEDLRKKNGIKGGECWPGWSSGTVLLLLKPACCHSTVLCTPNLPWLCSQCTPPRLIHFRGVWVAKGWKDLNPSAQGWALSPPAPVRCELHLCTLIAEGFSRRGFCQAIKRLFFFFF